VNHATLRVIWLMPVSPFCAGRIEDSAPLAALILCTMLDHAWSGRTSTAKSTLSPGLTQIRSLHVAFGPAVVGRDGTGFAIPKYALCHTYAQQERPHVIERLILFALVSR